MVVLIDKEASKGYICKDMSYVAEVLGVHRVTVKRRLPYWEDSRWIVCACDWIKSKRGTNNLSHEKG